MPALVNIAANFALGGATAWVTRHSPAVRREFVSWALLFLVGFEALAVTPVATFLFRFYPQWSMLYAFDPQIFPNLEEWIGLLSFLAILLNFAAALGGFHVTRLGVQRNQELVCYAPWAAGGFITLLILALGGRRVLFMGDYDAFWQGNADVLVTRAAGWVGLLLYASAAGFVFWLHRRFADHDPSIV
jgi:hypothetical protein